jgi:hypothetical protein
VSRFAWCLCVVLLFLTPRAYSQGLLERIRRGDAHSSSSSSSTSNAVDNYLNDTQNNGLDDTSLAGLSALGLFTVTSPFWLPPLALDDHYDQTASFSPYPYARFDSAYLNLYSDHLSPPANPELSFWDPDYLKEWSLQVQLEDGNDFNGLNRLGGRIAFDTASRFGLRSNWDWYYENLGNGHSDETLMFDDELTFRFAQADWVRMYVGVGCRAMEDRQTDRWGFDFVYGADVFPVWPLVLSTSIDLGDLGAAFYLDARATAGWAWRFGEVFIGYDYRRIGDVNLQGALAGFRLWF